jgi:hypothetical protein
MASAAAAVEPSHRVRAWCALHRHYECLPAAYECLPAADYIRLLAKARPLLRDRLATHMTRIATPSALSRVLMVVDHIHAPTFSKCLIACFQSPHSAVLFPYLKRICGAWFLYSRFRLDHSSSYMRRLEYYSFRPFLSIVSFYGGQSTSSLSSLSSLSLSTSSVAANPIVDDDWLWLPPFHQILSSTLDTVLSSIALQPFLLTDRLTSNASVDCASLFRSCVSLSDLFLAHSFFLPNFSPTVFAHDLQVFKTLSQRYAWNEHFLRLLKLHFAFLTFRQFVTELQHAFKEKPLRIRANVRQSSRNAAVYVMQHPHQSFLYVYLMMFCESRSAYRNVMKEVDRMRRLWAREFLTAMAGVEDLLLQNPRFQAFVKLCDIQHGDW